MLDKIKQNVKMTGINDLIKSSLDAIKEEKENEENEADASVSDASVIKRREAKMIEEGNEMYMISREVLNQPSPYRSAEFFRKYLWNDEEEKSEKPQAQKTVNTEFNSDN